MAYFILIHGAFHDRWCYRGLIDNLRTRGHEAVAIDLPGHGEEPIPAAQVTFDDQLAAIRSAVETAPHPAPILVGHSMSGMHLTAMAADLAPQIGGLVYVAGYIPRDGDTLLALDALNPAQGIKTCVTPAPDLSHATIDAEAASPLFYHDCNPSIRDDAAARLSPNPGAPMLTPVLLEGKRPPVPRAAIICDRDQVLDAEYQRKMAERAGIETVVTLPSGHSPFLSMPDHLGAELSMIDAVFSRSGCAAA